MLALLEDKVTKNFKNEITAINPPHANIPPQVAAAGSGGGYSNAPAAARIDNLANVTISNATVSGVSGLTDSDIPDGITASNYLPLSGGTITGNLTVSGAQTLSGAITVPYINATSTTVDSTFVRLTATNATTTNATSTSLFSTLGRLTTGIIDTLTATVATITNLTATTVTATNATTTRLDALDYVAVGRTSTTTIRGDGVASTIPYASSTAISVSGTGYFATASTTAFNLSGTATLQSIASDSLLYNNASRQLTAASVGSSLTFSSGSLSLNTGNANSWTGLQQFSNASTSLFSAYGTAYFGATATSSFSSTGALTLVSNGLTVGTNQFIVSGGNVGIGTTSPQNTLAVQGGFDLYNGSGATVNFKSTLKTLNFGTDSSGAFLLNDATAGLGRLFLTSGGAMGIGNYFGPSNLPTNSFDVAGAASIGLGIGGAVTAPSNGLLVSGNVGIGTTTPNWKLAISNSAGPQLALTDGSATSNQWTMRNAGGILYFATSTYSATSSISALSVNANGSLSVANLVSCAGVQTNANGLMSCTSDERLKDIRAPFTTGLAAVMQIHPQTWAYKQGTESYDGVAYSSFVAQDVQAAVPEAVSAGYGGWLQINMNTMLATAVNAIKEIGGISGAFRDALVAWMGDAANGIDKLFAREIYGDKLCARKSDGSFVCVTGDELAAAFGGAASGASGGEGAGGDTSTGGVTSGTSSPPVISINGNNPAVIHIGDSYADLGAQITGPQTALNLGINTFVNGTLVEHIHLDTSTTSSSTIDYVVSDTFAQTATATRTVIVK